MPAPNRLKRIILKTPKTSKILKFSNLCARARNAQPCRQKLPPSHINAVQRRQKATPRPDPSLLLGGRACRSPGVRSQQASGIKAFKPAVYYLFPSQRRPWQKTASHRLCSMVDLPCLHVTGHIPFASGANVNIRFFLHSAVLDRKLVPTHRRWSICPVFTSLATFPLHAGQT